MTRSPPRHPLIAIIGATGTGKSQLAVELAKRYNGEVINGDAMQLYAGLPIITNKITVEEQQGIPHHLLGRVDLKEQTWVVGTFVKKALGVIGEIRSRGRIPILVGGTHYYLQSLLFKDRLAENEEDEKPFVKDLEETWPILREDTAVLLQELKRVDPVMAERWHPNDRRKIQRSLEIYFQTGKKASDIYAAQREKADDETSGESQSLHDEPSMRFPTLLLWIHAEPEALNKRLEKRVEKMLEAGLLEEVHSLDNFVTSQVASGGDIDKTRGIWVSIGYKEFKAYMQALRHGIASEEELLKLKAEALERTKIATRQYAKRQVKWIRIKLVNALQQANAGTNLYLLDGSDVTAFDNDVVHAASDLAHDFLTAGSPLPDPKSVSTAAAEMLKPKRDYDLSAQPKKWQKIHCDLCDITCMTEDQWVAHAKSRAHRRSVAKRKKAEEAGTPPGAHG